MPLCLKDAVYQVRNRIGELDPYNWSNDQIITDLNFAAREMCSLAGALTRYQALQLELDEDTGTQEVALDVEIDAIKACKYFSGQLFDLTYNDWQPLQTGSSTGSIPLYYYTKTDTKQLTPQSTGTSNIVDIPIVQPMAFYRTVLGVWPIPPEPATIHVWYSYFHNWMSKPTDLCAIPEIYLHYWAARAIAMCFRNEKAHDEADKFDAMFYQGVEKYRIYASRQKQGDKPARYGVQTEPWRRNASSSVIFVDPFSTMGGA